jgi:2-isopropylmalate synthase
VSGLIHDWNREASFPARAPRRVELDDETLRDGLQAAAAIQPGVDAKLDLLRLMDALGIDTADIGLPGAGERMRRETLSVAREMAREGLRIAPNCAARTVEADLRPIAEIIQAVGRPVQVALFIGSSPIRQYTEGWTIETLVRNTRDALAFARANALDVMYVTEDTTRSRPEDLERLFREAVEGGASRLCLCDTCGHATPPGAAALVRWTRDWLDRNGHPSVRIDFHGHMDRGLGVWNSIAALEAGADRIHGTALGVGERVGNTPMDQLLVNLKLLGWIDRDLKPLAAYGETASRVLDVPIPPGYPVMGRDAFATATGVHAAAILKALEKGERDLADRVYSAVPAGDFGREQVFVIGPLSGRSNVVGWLRRRGLEAAEDRVSAVLELAKRSDRPLAEAEILAALRNAT